MTEENEYELVVENPVRYKVTFAHDNATKEDMFGWGTVDVELDKEPETDEELKELARSIGKTYGFTTVGVLELERLD